MSLISAVTGAVTASGAQVRCKVDDFAVFPELFVADNPEMSGAVGFGSVAPTPQSIATLDASGLDPNTQYWYQIEHGGVMDPISGKFKTFPVAGEPANFEVALSSCAGSSPDFPGTGSVLASTRLSNHTVYDLIRERSPLLFLHLGDLHYYDLSSGSHGIVGGSSLANFRRAYDDVLLQGRQHQLYRDIPWVYLYDDHDFLGNESDGVSNPTGAQNCLQAYRERVPHYTLTNPTNGMYQSFQIGRVLFVMLDGRVNRSPNTDPDGPSKTMLGSLQKAWLENVLAANASSAEFLVLCMGSQWTATTHIDSWASFSTERAEVQSMLGDTGWLDRMVAVYGDRHALGMDAGTNNPNGGFPLLMAASLDSTPSTPPSDRFDLGVDRPGRGQYGTISVNDWGSGMTVSLRGYYDNNVLWKTFTMGINVSPVLSSTIVRAVSGSHQARFEARVVETFQTGPDPEGTDIPIFDGDVQLDGTAEIRGTLSISTDGTRMWPRAKNQLLGPYGNEIFVRRGIELGGGGVEWVGLGYYRIDTPEQDVAPHGDITIAAKDRMAGIIDSDLLKPVEFDTSRSVGSVVRELITDVYPEAVIIWDDDTDLETLGRTIIAERERYPVLEDIMTVYNKIMYFDGNGILQIKTPPDSTVPVWEVKAGENGVLVQASRRLTREGVYNAVVAYGEGADNTTPVRHVAVDNGPTSLTRFGGKFGKIPRFYSSPLITTNQQAADAAANILRRGLGIPFSVDFTAVPNPALQPYDVVRVTYADYNRELHTIEKLTIPLTVEQDMKAGTRERSLIVIGEQP